MKSILVIITTLLSTLAQAEIAELRALPAKGKIQFEAIGRPSMVKIKGQSEGPEGSLRIVNGALSGEFLLPLQNLKTGIELRDEHMKDKYLEVSKYPQAKLTIPEQKLPDSWTTANPSLHDFKFKGVLQLHGEEKEISGTVNVKADLTSEAQFEIKISDYKIDIPSYLGITVADKVKISVSSAIEPQAK